MNEAEGVAKHIAKLEQIWLELQNETWKEDQVKLPDSLFLNRILNTLPSQYFEFVNAREIFVDAPFNTVALTHCSIITSYPTEDKPNELCLKPGFIHTASKVLEFMDPSVGPAMISTSFPVVTSEKNTNIPDDKSSVTTFSVIKDQLEEEIRTMIEEPLK
ncbi:hypothetical protein QE152_g6832 [Popillia japonica]|uniref:Uncharacterized protein n=1 Tax=Popillia japonica TaxID=7064 RepID=A0AAW1ME12_POPJA